MKGLIYQTRASFNSRSVFQEDDENIFVSTIELCMLGKAVSYEVIAVNTYMINCQLPHSQFQVVYYQKGVNY